MGSSHPKVHCFSCDFVLRRSRTLVEVSRSLSNRDIPWVCFVLIGLVLEVPFEFLSAWWLLQDHVQPHHPLTDLFQNFTTAQSTPLKSAPSFLYSCSVMWRCSVAAEVVEDLGGLGGKCHQNTTFSTQYWGMDISISETQKLTLLRPLREVARPLPKTLFL
jgi:hypothetical protein